MLQRYNISCNSTKHNNFQSSQKFLLPKNHYNAIIGYNFLDKHSSSHKRGSLTNKLLSVGSKKLAEYINKNGYDTVICTHPFSTVMLASAVERYSLNVNTAFVATDYTCAPTVDPESLDLYFVPDNAIISAFINYGIKEEKIVPSGIPVKQAFYNSRSVQC